MDREDARKVMFALRRLVVAIDKELGCKDAQFGQFS